jgi:hypothetical protein
VLIILSAISVAILDSVVAQARSRHAGPTSSQARALYAPVTAFERAVSRKQLKEVKSRTLVYARKVDKCQAPYQNQLFTSGDNAQENLYQLYENGSLLGQEQFQLRPVARQLRKLAGAWATVQIASPILRHFARGVAIEIHADVAKPTFDTCAFVKQIAAHHYSYAWAKNSSFARLVDAFQHRILKGAALTDLFWRYVYGTPSEPPPRGIGNGLFTRHQLHVLANLPGEAG